MRRDQPSAIKSQGDLVLGLVFIALAATALFLTRNLSGGSTSQMGPAYFPRALAIILLLLGGGIVLRSFTVARALDLRVRPVPMLAVVAGTLFFAVFCERLGAVLSIFGAVIIYAFAYPGRRIVETVLLAAGAGVFATLLFVVLLDLPLPIWPPFFD